MSQWRCGDTGGAASRTSYTRTFSAVKSLFSVEVQTHLASRTTYLTLPGARSHCMRQKLWRIGCCVARGGSHRTREWVFTLVTRGWAASEFFTRASKFNMTPNGAF